MVETQVEGIEETVWVQDSALKPNDYQHPPFPDELKQYIKKIKNDLDEIYPSSLKAWEDNFRIDKYPEKEIALWGDIGEVYQKLTSEKKLKLNKKITSDYDPRCLNRGIIFIGLLSKAIYELAYPSHNGAEFCCH